MPGELIRRCLTTRPFSDDAYRSTVERSEQGVSRPILYSCDLRFRLQHRVDTADCLMLVCATSREMRLGLVPRLATSVAISNSTWFLTSRTGAPSIATGLESMAAVVMLVED